MTTPDQPLVSIVIPAYNGMPYLEEAIESVLSQDYKNIELIVLDDGSTDGTSNFLKKYEGRFYYESHPNMGQAKTLNKGWLMSRGSILAYLSADDKLTSNAVSTSVNCLNENPEVVLTYADNVLINNNSQNIRKLLTPDFNYYQLFLESTTPVAVGSFFRRTAFDAIGGWNSNYKQIGDYEYHLRLSQLGHFQRIPEVLGFHRIHEQSASYAKMDFNRADEYKQLMTTIAEQTDNPLLLQLKEKILSRAYLISGRTHWRSNRYRVGFNYLICSIRLYPKSMLSSKMYRMIFNALFNRMLHQIFKKSQAIFTRFKRITFSD